MDDALRAFFDRLAEAAAAAILPHFRVRIAVEHKGGARFDPVTEADRAAERAIRALIEAHFPEDGLFGEELGAVRADAPRQWIIDPIDGTRAFIAGLPLWGVLIGLYENREPVAGLISQPYLGERFYGDARGARLSDRFGERPLRTRPCPSLVEATLMTTSPYLFAEADSRRYGAVEARARNVRYGADCYAYAMLAAGHVDLVIEAGLKPYDVAALVPVIRGAGGIVTAWDGGDPLQGHVVAAGDARVHAEAVALLSGR